MSFPNDADVPAAALRPPLNALRTFEAVARRGSFGAAAAELCVSQSAVSHQVRHLESWFGAPLFERRGGRPRLLPHAETLASALGASLSSIDAACRRARTGAGSPALVVAAIPSVAVCWLIPRLPDFRAEHPDIDVRVTYALHGHDIDYGEVDLAFVFGEAPQARADARSHDFLPGAAVPVCSPAVRDAMGGLDLVDAAGRVELLHDTDTAGWTSWFARAGAPREPVPPGPVFEDFNLLRAAALAGQGVALCPTAMLDEDLAAGRLVRLSDVATGQEERYWLVERTGADPVVAAATRAFVDWLLEARDVGTHGASVAPAGRA